MCDSSLNFVSCNFLVCLRSIDVRFASAQSRHAYAEEHSPTDAFLHPNSTSCLVPLSQQPPSALSPLLFSCHGLQRISLSPTIRLVRTARFCSLPSRLKSMTFFLAVGSSRSRWLHLSRVCHDMTLIDQSQLTGEAKFGDSSIKLLVQLQNIALFSIPMVDWWKCWGRRSPLQVDETREEVFVSGPNGDDRRDYHWQHTRVQGEVGLHSGSNSSIIGDALETLAKIIGSEKLPYGEIAVGSVSFQLKILACCSSNLLAFSRLLPHLVWPKRLSRVVDRKILINPGIDEGSGSVGNYERRIYLIYWCPQFPNEF